MAVITMREALNQALREEMLRDGVYPSFDAPLNRQVFLRHAIADRFNAFRLEEKVVVDKID